MGLLNKITKIAKAAYNEASKPESFSKGEEFEDYVRKYIFPNDRYELIHRTHSYNDNKGDYIESTLYPDFLFRCKETGKEFYVEAKFRSGFYDEKVEWTYPKQLKRYHEIDRKKTVFLCLGLHGTPKNPEFVFIIPMKKIKYTGLFNSFLDDYEFYIKKPVFSSYLWKLLK
jgi:hypothetical protein